MNILGYDLVNDEKVNRAIYGSIGQEGRLSGGVGENATDEVKLAEYDKLGGLITKDGNKVKTGSFYNFEKKIAREEPQITFEAVLDGNIVEVNEDEIKAIKTAEKKVATLKAKKIKKIK